MTRRRKLMLWITGALAAVAVLGPAFYYTQVFRPVRAFEELCLSEVKVDRQQIRDAAHRALRWQIHHDALVSLINVADESSIPVLMRSLRRVSPPDEDGLMICTTAHCFEALRKASGQNVRSSVEAWEDWYQVYRASIPPVTDTNEGKHGTTE